MVNDTPHEPHEEATPGEETTPEVESGHEEGAAIPEAGSAETPMMGGFARIIGVFTEPDRVMRSVAEKPAWLLPCIILLLSTLLFVAIAGDVLRDFALDQMRDKVNEMVAQGRIPAERSEQIIESQQGLVNTMLYVNPPIAVLFMRLLLTVLLLFLGNIILGGMKRFKHYWSLAFYGGMIAALAALISGVLIRLSGDMYGAQLGLGILARNNPDSTLFKILTVFNVFTIWEAVVVGIGLAVLANSKRSTGVVLMLIVYLGLGLFTSLLFGQSMV